MADDGQRSKKWGHKLLSLPFEFTSFGCIQRHHSTNKQTNTFLTPFWADVTSKTVIFYDKIDSLRLL